MIVIQMDFFSTLKQPQLITLFEMFYRRRIYPVVSSIFYRICGSIFNVLDYKNVTCTTPNLVLDYFEDTHIGHFRRNAPNAAPLFPIELWNMFHRTTEDLPRINNNIEAWHNSFQANVSFTHSTFWKFLDILLREEECLRTKQDIHRNHNDADTLIAMHVF